MKKYYDKYRKIIENNVDSFVKTEREYFDTDKSLEDMVKDEYMALMCYYIDSSQNEMTYLSNQREVIDSCLINIRELISLRKYKMVQYHIVALQLVLDIEVRFKKVLVEMILNNMKMSLFVNVDKYNEREANREYENIHKSILLKIREDLNKMNDQIDNDNKKGKSNK